MLKAFMPCNKISFLSLGTTLHMSHKHLLNNQRKFVNPLQPPDSKKGENNQCQQISINNTLLGSYRELRTNYCVADLSETIL